MSNTIDESLAALHSLRSIVLSNLQYQHYWADINLLNTVDDLKNGVQASAGSSALLPRPMVYGRPPEQLYNPEPTAPAAAEGVSKPKAEMEYVLPVHLTEKLSLKQWAAIFDCLPTPSEGGSEVAGGEGKKKRIVMAVVSGDSTVVYYIMHDGIVKPRQN